MSTEITHLTGYVLTTPTPGNTVTRVDGYILFELFPETKITQVTGYVLLEPKNRIPLNKEAPEAMIDLINRVSTVKWNPESMNISAPVAIPEVDGKNTEIVVSDTRSQYLGSYELQYTRRDVVESFVDISVPHAPSVHELIGSLAEVTGIALSESDFVDAPISMQDDTAVLEAADTSYFFIPGTQVTVTLLE